MSSTSMCQAVRKCVKRLWLIQEDFLKHTAGESRTPPILFRYQHVFKGIKVTDRQSLRCYVQDSS